MTEVVKGPAAWELYETFSDNECVSTGTSLHLWEEVYVDALSKYTFTCAITEDCEESMIVEIEEIE